MPGALPMPELSAVPAPPRPELLRLLRARLGESRPELRFVAEGLLGAELPIDWVAVEPSGRTLLVLVGADGADLELVARGLAQAAWVGARLGDWRQLAPDLGVRPGAGVRVVLLCPEFRPETLAAARALGERAPQLVRYRCLRVGPRTEAWLEPAPGAPDPAPAAASSPVPEAAPFRSGLSEAELSLSAEERAEFAADGQH